VEAAFDMAGGSGEFAILSATSTATNQNTWIANMEKFLKEDAKYKDLKLSRPPMVMICATRVSLKPKPCSRPTLT